MSSTGCEQLGWELLGGAAERVTRSVSGTNASHSSNNGNACCVARSRSSRRVLLLATFTPSTSRQCTNATLVQSRRSLGSLQGGLRKEQRPELRGGGLRRTPLEQSTVLRGGAWSLWGGSQWEE